MESAIPGIKGRTNFIPRICAIVMNRVMHDMESDFVATSMRT